MLLTIFLTMPFMIPDFDTRGQYGVRRCHPADWIQPSPGPQPVAAETNRAADNTGRQTSRRPHSGPGGCPAP